MIWNRLRAIFLANWEEESAPAGSGDEIGEALRKMEQSIGQARKETAQAMAEARKSSLQLQEQRRKVSGWQEQAEQAVLAADDDRARAALRNRKQCEIILPALQEQSALAEQTSQGMQQRLEQLQAQLEEARLQAGVLQARQHAADVRRGAADRSSDPFSQYERILAKMNRAEAEASALSELTERSAPPIPTEIASADETEPDAALRELKRRLGRG